MNMKAWAAEQWAAGVKRPMPVLSFPIVQKLGITVRDLVTDPGLQARGILQIARENDTPAALGMMDLSVEAEAFGAKILYAAEDIPTVVGCLVEDEAAAEALAVPPVGAGRTGLYVEAIRQVCQAGLKKPVFAGCIGPYSLAGRLMDVSEIMVLCLEEPDMVHTVLEKATAFLINYIRAYQAAGANGVLIAEPLAGLLSPALNEEFSVPYMQKIVRAVQGPEFMVIYHNCGGGTLRMVPGIASIGAMGCHFGNAIDLARMLDQFPADTLVFGNLDPVSQLCHGTPENIRIETTRLLEACSSHPNFIPSSGCDIPAQTPWENIEAFFQAVRDFYAARQKGAAV